jgi:hypothetical protein
MTWMKYNILVTLITRNVMWEIVKRPSDLERGRDPRPCRMRRELA